MEATEAKIIYKAGKKGPKITGPNDVHNFLLKIWDHDLIEYEEHAIILLMNRQNEILGFNRISTGGTTATIVDVKKVMTLCLLTAASGFIFAHNHPSGNLKFSKSDIAINEKLKNAGKLLDIELLDSIILTKDGYFSAANDW